MLTAGLVTTCSSTSRPGPGPTAARAPVVVASFNFPESELLAQIYADALRHAGVPVRLQLDLGTREMVMPALRQGLVDVVPEYLGSALAALDPPGDTGPGTAPSAAAERDALSRATGPWHLVVLDASAAQDQNGLAVSQDTARRYHLRTISDLARLAPRMTLGGPPECPARPYCLMGFRSVYDLGFSRFLGFDTEEQRVAALDQGVVDVAVMFTTDGELGTGRFVLLDDDRHLQRPENVTPVVSRRAVRAYGARVVATLDAVSARLTTPALVFLNWRIGPGGKAVSDEARGWLQRHGLLPRS